MQLDKIRRILMVFLLVVLFYTLNTNEEAFVNTSGKIFLHSADNQQVILGGEVVGFEYQSDGVLVVSNSRTSTFDGYLSSFTSQQLCAGDLILSIDDQKITSSKDISALLKDKDSVVVKVLRKDKEMNIPVMPVYDIVAREYKLGVWVKDSISGIGTVTYINPETQKFGALGHPVTEASTQKILPVKEGVVYDCSIIGIARGSKGMAGQLRGVMSKRKELGTVTNNSNVGIYGTMNNQNLQNQRLIDVGGQKTVKPGKAQIFCSVDNNGIKPYDIEIIKTSYQSVSNDKSLVFRVTDKQLLEKTGGIVQGMSGSPIVQNDKLVGAVTHVFLNDSTKGFGIYIDWML